MKIFLFTLISLYAASFSANICAESVDDNPALATIGKDIILKKNDVISHARPAPNLYTYLTIPGGPKRILDDLIKTRLLILEGQRLGMPRPGPNEGGDTAYTIAVRLRLAPRCSTPSEETVRAFYDANPGEFSTPLFMRLNRFGLSWDAENRRTVTNRLHNLSSRLSNGEISFATLASESDDDYGKQRGGDIGFLAFDDTSNSIMAELSRSTVGQIVGPVEQGGLLYLYQVTARREPVLEAYENIKAAVAQKQQAECYNQRTNAMFSELKERWPVKILVENIDSMFEAK